MALLEGSEVDAKLASLAGWQREGKEIHKQFEFGDFAGAMSFVNRVAEAAEAADHHPDITINYNRVTMVLSTHSEGGVTDKDLEMAAKIEAAGKS